MATLYILGINDDQTTCDLCGREELKKTIILAETEWAGEEIGRYGEDCAATLLARANGTKKPTGLRKVAEIKDAVRRANLSTAARWFLAALADDDMPAAIDRLAEIDSLVLTDKEKDIARDYHIRRVQAQGQRAFRITSANAKRTLVNMYATDLRPGDKVAVNTFNGDGTVKEFLGWLPVETTPALIDSESYGVRVFRRRIIAGGIAIEPKVNDVMRVWVDA